MFVFVVHLQLIRGAYCEKMCHSWHVVSSCLFFLPMNTTWTLVFPCLCALRTYSLHKDSLLKRNLRFHIDLQRARWELLTNNWNVAMDRQQQVACSLLGGGFKHFLFSSLNWGRWTHFDQYFSNGLKPPTRLTSWFFAHFCAFRSHIG